LRYLEPPHPRQPECSSGVPDQDLGTEGFGRLKDEVLDKPEKKAFHSFRHSFSERLKNSGVSDKVIGASLGHTDTSMTTGRNGSGEWPLQQLKEAVDRL
jgi:integrase